MLLCLPLPLYILHSKGSIIIFIFIVIEDTFTFSSLICAWTKVLLFSFFFSPIDDSVDCPVSSSRFFVLLTTNSVSSVVVFNWHIIFNYKPRD